MVHSTPVAALIAFFAAHQDIVAILGCSRCRTADGQQYRVLTPKSVFAAALEHCRVRNYTVVFEHIITGELQLVLPCHAFDFLLERPACWTLSRHTLASLLSLDAGITVSVTQPGEGACCFTGFQISAIGPLLFHVLPEAGEDGVNVYAILAHRDAVPVSATTAVGAKPSQPPAGDRSAGADFGDGGVDAPAPGVSDFEASAEDMSEDGEGAAAESEPLVPEAFASNPPANPWIHSPPNYWAADGEDPRFDGAILFAFFAVRRSHPARRHTC